MVDIEGRCDERFAEVREAFRANFDEGLDVGASTAVFADGELVVDLWGGHVDPERTRPWAEDTIINVFSSSKTMTFLTALLLVDRGELDLSAPVARYWPAFAAAGKDRVEVRHLLGHTAGLSGWDEQLQPGDLYDWEKCTSLLAGQAPWWEPGTKSGYHGLTQGYLIGEVVRQITGESIGTVFAREVAGPLGADFHIGLPPRHDDRVVRVIPPPPPARPVDAPADGLDGDSSTLAGAGGADRSSIGYRTFSNPLLSARQSWDEAWRRAEIPAANGHGNARSVATVQAVLAGGGELGGRRLLSPQTCERVFDVQAAGRDLVLGVGVTFGMGYGLNSPRAPIGPNPRLCYWGGWGGSLVVADLDARLCVGYVMNRMGEGTVGDQRAHRILQAAHRVLATA